MENALDFTVFWGGFKGHVAFLEESVKLGHNEAFKKRYDEVNEQARLLHPHLKVEFGLDMMSAVVTSITITSNSGEGRKVSLAAVEACPEELKDKVTPYRLPVLPWDKPVTKNWVIDMCKQFGANSIADQVGECLVKAKVLIKTNPENGKVLIQFGFKNKREHKAVGDELVLLMFDLLLGEEIVSQATESLSIKTIKELPPQSNGWAVTSTLELRDTVLKNLI